MIVLLQGMVKVVRADAEGKLRLLAFRGPGDVVGELATRDGGVRLATVTTISTCELVCVAADAFSSIVRRHHLEEVMAVHLIHRLREQTQVGEGDLDHAVAAALLKLAKISESSSLSITREELAQHLGVGRNSITRAIERIGSRCIRAGRTQLLIVDQGLLRGTAEGSQN